MEVTKSGEYHVPPPPDSSFERPVIGERPRTRSGRRLPPISTALAQQFAPQLKSTGLSLLGAVAGVGVGFLMFIAALIIAGIVMAFGENGTRSAVRISSRVTGPERGPKIAELCTATIRAVAQGVVGIAFIQMLLIGVAFLAKAFPALASRSQYCSASVQLPATLITIPVIAAFAPKGDGRHHRVRHLYVRRGARGQRAEATAAGRGLDVPMPVILIGAIGGMITGGIIGFIGPVVLAVSYQLFWQWVDQQPPSAAADAQPPT